MTPERWQKVNDLFHSALKCDPADRAAFLEKACGDDSALRTEIESLITSHDNSDGLVEAYPFEAAMGLFKEDQADLTVGQRIGQYKILSLLGRGGMGEVYLAYDSKLGRKVALKLLPSGFTQDQDRVRRFEQEARAASALNHPNILTIFDIEKIEGTHFIATEYIEGETLRQRIADGNLELTEIIDVAIQVASALSAAHQTGIAHRDIKPENIMLRPDGYVKVLDFGLAKLSERSLSDTHTESRPFMAVKTDTGVVIGTASYMSPEQARGQQIDERSDIFSFGAVFYELLTGEKAFRGDSDVDTLHSIMYEEPLGVSALKSKVPPNVFVVVERCLEKEPNRRYQNGAELQNALKQCSSLDALGSPRTVWRGWRHKAAQKGERRHSKKNHLNPLFLFVPMIMIGFGIWFLFLRPTSKSALSPMKVVPFTSLTGSERDPSFSPDGSKIAFSWSGDKQTGNSGIYVKQIEAGNALRLTTHPADDRSPVWSPDGSYIAFSRFSESDGGIYIVPSLGGAVRKVYAAKWTDAWFSHIDWSPDGKLLAFQDRETAQEPYSIYLLTLETLEKRKLTTPTDEYWSGDRHPIFSPDGKNVAFLRDRSIVTDDLYVVSLSGGDPKRLSFDNVTVWGLAWTPDGTHLVFSSKRGGSADTRCWMLNVTTASVEPTMLGGERAGDVTISRQGDRLAYTVDSTAPNTVIWRIEIPSSTGLGSPPKKFIASTRNDLDPQYSPDGNRISFCSDRSGSDEIWICDSDGTNFNQLTQLGGPISGSAHWSPDGKQIVFDSRPEGRSQIFLISAEGGRPRRITNGDSDDTAPSWSRDGKWVYFVSNSSGEQKWMKVPVEGGEAVPVTGRAGYWGFESPDEKFFYYDIESDGQSLSSFVNRSIWRIPMSGGHEEQVLTKGIQAFGWAVTRQGIYFINSAANRQPKIEFYNFATGRTKQIAMIGGYPPVPGGFALSPDGRWILYTQSEGSYSTDIMLVENFR